MVYEITAVTARGREILKIEADSASEAIEIMNYEILKQVEVAAEREYDKLLRKAKSAPEFEELHLSDVIKTVRPSYKKDVMRIRRVDGNGHG